MITKIAHISAIMKKAVNAAIRINSLHMAKGKTKMVDGNNKVIKSINKVNNSK